MKTNILETNKEKWTGRGGPVVVWPEVKKQGHLPKGDKVSEHLQTGLGGCYALERQTQLQFLSQTEILRKERTSLKAWLLFHLNSVPGFSNLLSETSPLSWHLTFCTVQALTSSICFYSLFISSPLQQERKDQTRSVSIGLGSGLQVWKWDCASVYTLAHLCVYMLMLPGIHQHNYIELKMNGEGVFSQSINQQLIVINPTGWAPAAKQ